MDVSAKVGIAARAAMEGGKLPVGVATEEESKLVASPRDGFDASRPIEARSEDEACRGVVTVGADDVVIAAMGR